MASNGAPQAVQLTPQTTKDIASVDMKVNTTPSESNLERKLSRVSAAEGQTALPRPAAPCEQLCWRMCMLGRPHRRRGREWRDRLSLRESAGLQALSTVSVRDERYKDPNCTRKNPGASRAEQGPGAERGPAPRA
jgi:hypothetical protein